MTNRILSAEEALSYDIVDQVVADDELAEAAETQVRAFATGPTQACSAGNRLIDGTFEEPGPDGVGIAVDCQPCGCP